MTIPSYLSIPETELGRGQPVKVQVLADAASLAKDFAQNVLDGICAAQSAGRAATFIVTVGGDISIIPERAITIGMKEILASRQLRFYCNRAWQSAAVRRALHGPLTPSCPASFFRTHPDAMLTLADFVAARPNIQLR